MPALALNPRGVELDVYGIVFSPDFVHLLRAVIDVYVLVACRKDIIFQVVALAKQQLFKIASQEL